MPNPDAYLFYEAGQAVAAAHLGLTIRHVSGNPAHAASDIILPRDRTKVRVILWLTGMAAEKKGVGQSDPLRRMRNRKRIRLQIEFLMAGLTGSSTKRLADATKLMNQAQDRANAICSKLYPAIEQIVERLRAQGPLSGKEVIAIVKMVKAGQPKRPRAAAKRS